MMCCTVVGLIRAILYRVVMKWVVGMVRAGPRSGVWLCVCAWLLGKGRCQSFPWPLDSGDGNHRVWIQFAKN